MIGAVAEMSVNSMSPAMSAWILASTCLIVTAFVSSTPAAASSSVANWIKPF